MACSENAHGVIDGIAFLGAARTQIDRSQSDFEGVDVVDVSRPIGFHGPHDRGVWQTLGSIDHLHIATLRLHQFEEFAITRSVGQQFLRQRAAFFHR